MKECDKLIKNNYRIKIIQQLVGPLTEADLNSASQTGAVVFGFDVQCPSTVTKKAFNAGVTVKMHKLIYKFIEDFDNFVHDAKQEMDIEKGKLTSVEVKGTATVSQIFKVKAPTKTHPNKIVLVAGCQV